MVLFPPLISLYAFNGPGLGIGNPNGPTLQATTQGRIQFLITRLDSGQPVNGAQVHIKASATQDLQLLRTNNKGNATSELLDAGDWLIVVEAKGLTPTAQVVSVPVGKTVDISIGLAEPAEKVLVISATKLSPIVAGSSGVTRGQQFIQKFGGGGGNGQSLTNILKTNPGLAADSSGQVHPVGEHSATSIIIDGFQIPGSIPGRQGEPVVPDVMNSLDVMTGNYAPKYGRETAAILDVDLIEGGPKPIDQFSQSFGTYSTAETSALLSGQIGAKMGLPLPNGLQDRKLSYLLDFDFRSTDNAVEPPQPSPQSDHNGQSAGYLFGHFSYALNPTSTLRLSFGSNPVETQVANRTGLPSFYIPFGQGYGFGGAQPASAGLPSQQQLGQDIYQTDYNEFGVASYVHNFGKTGVWTASFGLTHNGLNILNHNPSIDLNNLPPDSSIEYNPTLIRNQRDAQGSTSLKFSQGAHHFEFGLTYDGQEGNDSYQLTPASQAALNNLLSGDPTNSTPDPTNPLYTLAPVNGVASTVTVSRIGAYKAAFAQDTWQISKKFSINTGARWEQYIQHEFIQQNGGPLQPANESLSQLEPRINLAYDSSHKFQFTASFNRLMIIPPTPQGLSVNLNSSLSPLAPPETVSQFGLGSFVNLGRHQTLSVNGIYKELTNQLDTGLLVPGAQIGSYASASIPGDTVRALEVGYEVSSGKPTGMDAYVSYQNALAKIKQIPGSTYFGIPYNDHDQLHTLTIGCNNTFKGGASVGLTYSYGSGFFSSTLPGESDRHPHDQWDFTANAPFKVHGEKWSLSVGILNLFNKTNELNFLSGFDGTRFQQGRRLTLSLSGKF